METISIYDYTDYRVFLRDYCHHYKQLDAKYSQRYFALKLGVKSSGFLSEVINGKRNLSRTNVAQFCRTLKLSDTEQQYFENLVTFNQARSQSEKEHWLNRLMVSQNSNLSSLRRDIYEYFSNWYVSAIRELLFFYTFDGNYKQLASTLTPQIKPSQAKEALDLLLRLGLVRTAEEGRLVQAEAVISTGDEVHSTEVAKFQMQMLELARQALDRMPANRRDISTLTLSVSQQGFEKIRAIIQRTRKEILSAAVDDTNEDRVVQLNIQLFPLADMSQSEEH
jgi:uncharacterized protein (TIGR02147 family)